MTNFKGKNLFNLGVSFQRWVARFCLMSFPIAALMTTTAVQPAKALNGCSGSDCVQHNLQTQAVCTQVGTDSSPNQPVSSALGWAKGLNTEIDQNILKGNVIAYKIQWSSGNWSNWYVTGINDLDVKFNTNTGDMRRMWSYFTDHKHLYIICKQP